jgi:hypothetical protein
MKRSFWTHQIVEYVLGIAAIAIGAQSPDPLVASLAGVLVLLNAACTDGPLGAFRLLHRHVHHVIDIVLVVLFVVVAIVGGSRVDSMTRVTLVGIAAALAFVTWQTDFSKRRRPEPVPAGERSEQFGRTAGRVAGNAVNMWKRKRSGGDAEEA